MLGFFSSRVRDHVKKQINKGRSRAARYLAEVKREAAVAVREAKAEAKAAGFKLGREEGRVTGREDGYQSGRNGAYRQAIREFQLEYTNPDGNSSCTDAEFEELQVDLFKPRPNIYRCKDRWIVRIINDSNDRVVQEFLAPLEHPRSGGDTTAVTRALVEAIVFRNSFADHFGEYHALWLECLAFVNHRRDAVNFNAAMEFYKRRSGGRHELHAEVPGVFGKDPEDRFDSASLMNRPWSCMFTNINEIKRMGMTKLGLGDYLGVFKEFPVRTVRSLLLLTADDITKQPGIGPVALQKIRQGLTDHGLALWGDPVPSPSLRRDGGQRQPGERNFRAIDLG